MDKTELMSHLKKLHEKVIAEMKNVVNIICKPIDIVIQPLLREGGVRRAKVDGKEVDQIVMNDIFSEDNIADAEYTLAHETGHYFNMLNPRVREEFELRRLIHRTRRGERMYNYAELVANFFAINYFDRTEGIVSFFNGRERVVNCDGVTRLCLFYNTFSVQERGRVCDWLTNRSYEEAKKDMRKNPFKNSLREIINRNYQ